MVACVLSDLYVYYVYETQLVSMCQLHVKWFYDVNTFVNYTFIHWIYIWLYSCNIVVPLLLWCLLQAWHFQTQGASSTNKNKLNQH